MHAIMLSTDRTIFDPASAARKRMEEYANTLGKLSVIIFCKKDQIPLVGALSLYPTNSSSRISYIRDATIIAHSIEKADVVTAQDPFEAGLAALSIAKIRKIPLHIQVHTNFLAPGFSVLHWPLNLFRLFMARKVLKYASKIRTVSTAIQIALQKKYHPVAPISVLPIFVDVKKYRYINKTRHLKFATVLLVISRLEKEKRVDEALYALQKVRDAGISAGLVIVGSGKEELSLKALSKKLGIEEYVEFHGFQTNLLLYFAMADVLVYSGAPYEGYGMGIIEALAAGVPVVAKDVGIAAEAGAVIAEGDLGDTLVAFLKNPQKPQLRYTPYASKEEYLKKFKEDLTISTNL